MEDQLFAMVRDLQGDVKRLLAEVVTKDDLDPLREEVIAHGKKLEEHSTFISAVKWVAGTLLAAALTWMIGFSHYPVSASPTISANSSYHQTK